MNGFPSERTVQRIKALYRSGTRVKLVRMDDPYTKLAAGTYGTVTCVDDIGTVHVRWDNGMSLGVVYGEDEIEKVWG